MTTSEGEKPGLLVMVAGGIAELALDWLHVRAMFATLVLALMAAIEAFSAGGSVAVVGVVAAVGTTFALFWPLARHWGPLSTWLTMLTAMAVNLGVILVLGPP